MRPNEVDGFVDAATQPAIARQLHRSGEPEVDAVVKAVFVIRSSV